MAVKQIMITALVAALVIFSGCANSGNTSGSPAASTPVNSDTTQTENAVPSDSSPGHNSRMFVTSSAIISGVIDPVYGANGTVKEGGVPVLSIPLEISGAPAGTACYAVYMDDPDAKPLCGFNWVHWMVVNIEESEIPKDFSRTAKGIIQGKNDSGTTGYAGPTPPDKDHTYAITVYALDEKLELTDGFSKTEFADAIEGHVLASALVEGIYNK